MADSYGLHVIPDKRFNNRYGACICFSGQGQTKPPSERGIALLIKEEELDKLTDQGEPAQQRILRLRSAAMPRPRSRT